MAAKAQTSSLFRRMAPVLVLALFAGALWLIQHQLRRVDFRSLRHAVSAIPTIRIVAALGLTALSYLLLTLYDAMALRYIGRGLSYGRTALASFTGYVFNFNIGLSVLGGTAVRYRVYSTWGLTALDIGKIVAFCALTAGVGLFTISGTVFVLGDVSVLSEDAQKYLPIDWLPAIGGFFLGCVVGYVVVCHFFRKPIRLRSWSVALPPPQLAIAQIVVAAADISVAGAVLYALHGAGDVSYPVFLGVYVIALVAGLISHVPGGLGVFESVFIAALPTHADDADVLATLLAFRAVYYLIPLGVGTVMLAAHEALRQRHRIARVADGFTRGVSALAPRVMAVTTFIGGAILLASGATPTLFGRVHWLRELLPLPVVEVSHFLGSVAGACLLFLARGLQRRLNAAWVLAAALLGAGVLFSLAKGLDWVEALVLAFMLVALMSSRREFYRKSSLLDQRYTPGWVLAIGLVLVGTAWLGLFAYKHVQYTSDLWWRFGFRSDAPRFLRASAGVAVVGLLAAVARLLRHPVARPVKPSPADLDDAARLAAASPATAAWLALLGDKTLFFSKTREAFLMYSVAGRNWVAMGDPVGAAGERTELAWHFRELCDQQGAWTVFYGVSPAHLPLYLDLGLSLFKLGEEGRVPLAGFSLEGSARKDMRATRSRLEREGCSFAVWTPDDVRARIGELRAISDDWLERKNTREKGFSLGSFDEQYLTRFPAGVVSRDGKPVAFANLWPGGGREEMAVDLRRFSASAPDSVLEYLFIQLMLHAAAEGYAWFNLGMAPLSGIEDHPLAPLWNRLGAVLFNHGEHFYNFQGLRAYKEKFDPVWQPKYLACPGGLILPRVLTGVATLISGGAAGLVKK
jgi:phosphatidylglycerol lysyltransferase